MPHYHRLGKIPRKRHTQFRRPDGELYKEELFSTEGFANLYSNLYHIHQPTAILEIGQPYSIKPEIIDDIQMKHRSFQGFKVEADDDYLQSRVPMITNADVQISMAAPRNSMEDYFFKNADADEVIFIHEGDGTLKTAYGSFDFTYGDYVLIPRGTVYQMKFKSEKNKHLVIESFSPVVYPKRYRNELGQLLEHSPYCERDIKQPTDFETHDETGEFLYLIKKEGMIYPYTYKYHPFDLIGWDGFHYPYALSIHDFEPITGRIHQPPPVHQTFSGRGFVICSFVPRKYDYHPLSIPAPYAHSNIDSDEVMYYVDGQFMSKGHVDKGQMSLHPGGIPHGPTPGATEKSLGKEGTEELAVMIDTFKPLYVTKQAMKYEIDDYYLCWVNKEESMANLTE
ncbi:MAG: homogentisate 1,2-dioxygenase [Chitinophagales bacterium]|nr:homogentisate 1,2-dioxygenase [Chitinophagales bacterium]